MRRNSLSRYSPYCYIIRRFRHCGEAKTGLSSVRLGILYRFRDRAARTTILSDTRKRYIQESSAAGVEAASKAKPWQTFFDGNPATDFNGLIAYIKSHTLDQTLAEIRASKINPNDLPGLGDTAKLFLKEDGYAHARVFYAEGIRQLEAAPHLVAPDVNVLFARRNLCALYMPDQAGDALAVIEEDPQLCQCRNKTPAISPVLTTAAAPSCGRLARLSC